MPNRARFATASTAVLAVLAGIAMLGLPHLSVSPPPQARPAFDFRFHWPAGSRYTYAVEWLGEQSAQLQVDLAATVELTSLGERNGAFLLAARVTDRSRTLLLMLGRSAFPEPADATATFDGRVAYMEVEPNGRIRAIRFQPADPPLFKHVMQFVLGQSQVVLPSRDGVGGRTEWTSVEPGPFGESKAIYQARSARPPSLSRTRVSYQRLDAMPGELPPAHTVELEGVTEIELVPEGHLRSLRLGERVRVSMNGAAPLLAADLQLRWTLLAAVQEQGWAGLTEPPAP